MNDKHRSNRETFLEPETRCDYYIDAKIKRVWKVLLDMLEIVMQVCRENHLQFWMSGGSLLGAARHNGIIPWDDDVDVELPRKDYDKLMKLLPSCLPKQYFLQTMYSQNGHYLTHAKIRNENTAAIDMTYVNGRRLMNMGIFLDLFPLDGVPKYGVVRRLVMKWVIRFRASRSRAFYRSDLSGWKQKLSRPLYKIIFRLLGRRVYSCLTEFPLKLFPMDKCSECQISPGEWPYENRKLGRESVWYNNTVTVPFEYLDVPIPADYDQVLTRQFGDWHKFYRGGAYHGISEFSVETPYKQLLKTKYGYTDAELAECGGNI